MHRLMSLAAVAALAAAPAFAADTKISLNGENTKIEFVGSKPDKSSHAGGFKKLSGTASVAGEDVKSLTLDLTIETESIYSDSEKLTAHLKNPDFFSVKQHPKATFKSTKVAATDKGHEITGELTLLGKKKSITIPAEIGLSGDSLKLKSEFELDRTAFGMTYGKGQINEKVAMKVAVDAKRK